MYPKFVKRFRLGNTINLELLELAVLPANVLRARRLEPPESGDFAAEGSGEPSPAPTLFCRLFKSIAKFPSLLGEREPFLVARRATRCSCLGLLLSLAEKNGVGELLGLGLEP